MIINLRQLKNRVKKHGANYYRYVGRVQSNDGLHSYAVIDDCYEQDTIHVEEDDETISKICGPCEN